MRYTDTEKYISCECGGTIGSYDRGDSFTCERCRRQYKLWELDYDTLRINEKTGWVFPMSAK